MKIKNIENPASVLFFALLIPLILLGCSSSKTAVKLNADDIKNMVDSSQFVFVAERVTPLRGGTRHLTSRYDVIVKKDSVDCALPYFGRAYQAPIDPSKGGIQFTSTNFSYKQNSNNNGWEVLIKPNDNSDVQQLMFNIFGNGTATLNVVNTHREPISFYGHIERVNQ
jgi:hypothetical protein